MIRPTLPVCCLLLLLLLGPGCATSSNITKYTQAQLSALTTREVEASFNDTFRAATDALFDSGYTIEESDRAGGIITGEKAKDQSSARFWVSPYIKDTVFKISVLLREIDARNTSIRLSLSRNGEPYIDETIVDQFWRLMRRQVMMKEPPADPTAIQSRPQTRN